MISHCHMGEAAVKVKGGGCNGRSDNLGICVLGTAVRSRENIDENKH